MDFTFICPTGPRKALLRRVRGPRVSGSSGSAHRSFYCHKAWFGDGETFAKPVHAIVADTSHAMSRAFGV
jgi:alkyl hydroperoxide reductase subunit AhpC